MTCVARSAGLVGIAVFSRLDSTRLPGKALRPIAGRPLIGRVVDRVRQVTGARPIIATTDRPTDDPIAAFAIEEGIDIFRGDALDVAGRALACAEHFDLHRLVRISGDSPFIPPELIVELLGHPLSDERTLVTNVFPRSYSPGASVEVFGRQFLAQLLSEPLTAEDREHVSRYAYRHPEKFRIINVESRQADASETVLTVDTPDDLASMERLALALGPDSATASLEKVVAVARGILARTRPR